MFNKHSSRWLFLLIIFGIAFGLRFYKLGTVPNGLYQDETAIGYNSYSILKTGADEHGSSFPVYFKSFGDYKLPLYIYATSLSVKIFGLTPLAVRLPSALFGFLTLVVFYKLTQKLFPSDHFSYLVTLLFAVNPWHIHYSRAAFEVSLTLLLFIIGFLCIVRSLVDNRKYYFTIGTIVFVLSLYTYNLTRLLAPLFYFILIFFYKKNLKKIPKNEKIFTLILAGVCLIPFLLTFLTKGGFQSAAGTLITSSAAVRAPLLELKSYATLIPFISKIFLNVPLLTLWQYVNNIALYFSVPFFFVSGSIHGNHGIGNVGLFYLFEFPLVIIGIWEMLKTRKIGNTILLSWAAVTIMTASITRDVPHATRSFFLLPTFIIASALGFQKLLYFWNKSSVNAKTMLTFICGSFIIYNFIYYLFSYYVRFPVSYSKSWRSADRDIGYFLSKNAQYYDRVIIDKNSGLIYSSIIFYTNFPPDEFQRSTQWSNDDSEGFSFPITFGKYIYRDVDWSTDLQSPNTLIITSADKPGARPANFVFYYPERPVVIAVGQEIKSFPVHEIAYMVFDTNKNIRNE